MGHALGWPYTDRASRDGGLTDGGCSHSRAPSGRHGAWCSRGHVQLCIQQTIQRTLLIQVHRTLVCLQGAICLPMAGNRKGRCCSLNDDRTHLWLWLWLIASRVVSSMVVLCVSRAVLSFLLSAFEWMMPWGATPFVHFHRPGARQPLPACSYRPHFSGPGVCWPR